MSEKIIEQVGDLIRQHHNHGYATEMLHMAIADLFEKGYHEIRAGAFRKILQAAALWKSAV